MSVKTAVATSPSMCQVPECEKSAEKLIVVQHSISSPNIEEFVLCYEDFDRLIYGIEPRYWVAENL